MAFNKDVLKKSIDSRKGNSEFWKPTKDKHIIRILPTKDKNLELPWVRAVFHYKLPLESGAVLCGKTYTDPTKKYGEGSCPVCDLIARLYRAGTPKDKALANSIKASSYYYMNILDRTDKDVNPMSLKPQVYKFSKGVKEELENAFVVKKDKQGNILKKEEMVDMKDEDIHVEVLDLSDIEKGYSLQLTQITKTIRTPDGETKNFTTYSVTRSSKQSAVVNAEKIMKEAKDLTQYCLLKPDFNVLKKNAKVLAGENVDLAEDEGLPQENEGNISFDSKEVDEYSASDNDIPF